MLGHLHLMLMGIPVCKWAEWARHLTQVCLWKKISNYDKRSFGLGWVCSLSGLEDFYRVNLTEAAWGSSKRLGLFFLNLSSSLTLDILCLLPGLQGPIYTPL